MRKDIADTNIDIDDSLFPEHVPIIPYDNTKDLLKEEARKQAKKLREENGKTEPFIVTNGGKVKKASELTLIEQEDEILKCIVNPVYFIETYLTIFDQTVGIAGMIVPFKLFEFQKDLILTFRENRFVIANKYRQAGISTTTCAYIAWYVMFNKNRSVAIVADKLETARDELMNDVVDFIENCPAWLRPKTGKETDGKFKDTQKLKRYDNGSTLSAFSSKGLRGYTPTLLFWDETAWTEKSDKFWTSAKPTLQTGGSAIMVSTPSGLDAVFYKTFSVARKGKNNFVAVELWWFNDPRYNKELAWYRNKGKENEIKFVDEGWDKERRIKLMDDGWEASSPWFEEQVRDANGDMRKIAQEILCVRGDAMITIKNKQTQIIETIRIKEFYEKLKEQNNSSTYLYLNEQMKKKVIATTIGINIEKYRIKGGLSMFNKDYPNLINEINFHTKEMQICSMNKTLFAKLLYLKKYNGEINKIKDNDKILVFDRNVGDFIIKAQNSAKKSWEIINNIISSTNEFYSKEETIELLKSTYEKYLGKSGNRKLLSENVKLYASVYHHTSFMNGLNENLNKFSSRLIILVNNINIYCTIHNKLKHWKIINKKLVIICADCEPKYPSVDWFKLKYADNWLLYHTARKDSVRKNKSNSREWFIRKFGVDGGEKYSDYVSNKMEALSILKANRYSKISQELFWKIYNYLEDKSETYFHDLNNEYVIRIPDKYNHENTVMMLDFKYKNKIIEYNGNYWHNSEKDNIRYSILKEMGYDVLVVTSDEYNRNKKSANIVDKCLKFLTC